MLAVVSLGCVHAAISSAVALEPELDCFGRAPSAHLKSENVPRVLGYADFFGRCFQCEWRA